MPAIDDDKPVRFATRAEMRSIGEARGRAVAAPLIETVASMGDVPDAILTQMFDLATAAVTDMEPDLRGMGCRDRQIVAYRAEAMEAIGAQIRLARAAASASGSSN